MDNIRFCLRQLNFRDLYVDYSDALAGSGFEDWCAHIIAVRSFKTPFAFLFTSFPVKKMSEYECETCRFQVGAII